MEIRGAVILFLCVTFARLSFQKEQQCLDFVLRNPNNPVEASFFNYLEQYVKENKIVEPISTYLNTGRLDVSVSFWISYNDSKVNIKLENVILKPNSNYSDPDFYLDKYHNFDKNELLTELQALLKQNISNIMYNRVVPDTVNSYLKNIMTDGSLVNVNITIMAHEFHINIIRIGSKDCFMSSDYNHNQRHKRSTGQNKKCSSKRRLDYSNDAYGDYAYNFDYAAKRARVLPENEGCSNKRSTTVAIDEFLKKPLPEEEDGRKIQYFKAKPQRLCVVKDTVNKFVKRIYNDVKEEIIKVKKRSGQPLNSQQLSRQLNDPKMLPSVLKYLQVTGEEVVKEETRKIQNAGNNKN